jgi:uncharacterized protein
MKYLLVLAVLLIAFWVWRNGREKADDEAARRGASQKPPSPQSPRGSAAPVVTEEMVSCAVCGVHLPLTDAVRGKRAVYCGQPHRLAAEP